MNAQLILSNKYVKIVLDDGEVLSRLNKLFSYQEPSIQFSRAYQNGYGWNGINYLMNKKCEFPIGLLNTAKEFLQDNQISFEIIDNRSVVENADPIDISQKLAKLKMQPRYYQINAVKEALNHRQGIVKSCTGSGKCSDINSLHITEFGLLNYAELQEMTGTKLNSGSTIKLEMKLATPLTKKGTDKSSMLYRDGYGPSRKITTQYGFTLTATHKHKIQVINQCGSIIWKEFKDLQVGDYSIISYGNQIFGKERISLDDAYWYGLLLGDGNLTQKNQIKLTNMDKHILNFSFNYLKSKNIKYSVIEGKSKAVDIAIYNTKYRKELFNFGLDYCKSIHKTIPANIRKLEKSPLSMVLRGLYETDGWVEKAKGRPAICIGLSNKKMIDQLHLLLLNFGIVASRRIKKTSNNDSHILTIYKEFIPLFIKEIGFDPLGHKFHSLNDAMKYCKEIELINNSNTNLIPNQEYNLHILYKNYCKLYSKKDFYETCPIKKSTFRSWEGEKFWRRPSREKLLQFIIWYREKLLEDKYMTDDIKIILTNIQYICDSKFYCLPISEIEETYSNNYDFVIPNTHSFVSQGFINHNTLMLAILTAALNKPTIILVIGLDLLQQMHSLFSKVFDEEIGYIGNGVCEIRRINIVSLWTASRALGLKNKIIEDDDLDKEKFNESDADQIQELLKTTKVLAIDECHISSTESVKKLYRAINPEYLYGFSGTPHRDDETDIVIRGFLGEVIVNISASELIEKGYLIRPSIKFFDVPKKYLEADNYPGVYKEYVIENETRNEMIVSSTQKLVGAGYQTLVLFRYLNHGQKLFEMLQDRGINCAILNGRDKLEKREEIKQQLLDGKLDCILASVVYDCGVDIASLNGLVLAGGGKSSVRTLQRIGRVIRISPTTNKRDVKVVDFIDNAKYLKGHSKKRAKIYRQEKGFEVLVPNGIKL
jgi:superfamily II DNA or RNA helicase/intein/homing endonuclease